MQQQQQQPYNPSVQGPGRPFARWKRGFLIRLPTEAKDLLQRPQLVIPDVEARKIQLQHFRDEINLFTARVANNEAINAADARTHEMRMNLAEEMRKQIKEMEEEIKRITTAGDAVLQLIRETTAGDAFQSIVDSFGGAGNRMIQGRQTMAAVSTMWRGRPMLIYNEILDELNGLKVAMTKEETLTLLIKVKALLQEFRSLQEEFPNEAALGHFPAIPTDVSAVHLIRNKLGSADSLRMMRDFAEEPRAIPLTLAEFEERIIHHCQQPEQEVRQHQQQQQPQQQQRLPQPAHMAAAAAGGWQHQEYQQQHQYQQHQQYPQQQHYPQQHQQYPQQQQQQQQQQQYSQQQQQQYQPYPQQYDPHDMMQLAAAAGAAAAKEVIQANAAIPNQMGAGGVGGATAGTVAGWQQPTFQGQWGGGGYRPPRPPQHFGPRTPATEPWPCRYYRGPGTCPYGESCIYKHGEQDPRFK